MAEQGTTLPDRMEWCARHLRMIAFPVEPQLTAEQNWWAELTGSQPEATLRKPQKREDSGTFQGVALTVEVDPFRVKWTVAPRIDADNFPDEFPTLGRAFERRDWLIDVMGRWLTDCPPIKRLAFAANLLQFVDSREEAYSRLNKYLLSVEVDPDSSDFMYRVNRRRESQTGIEGLRINRLCTWAAAKLSFGLYAVSQGTGESQNVSIKEDQNACVLELDVNTVPDFPGPQLPKDTLLQIYTELVDVGLETAELGDCR